MAEEEVIEIDLSQLRKLKVQELRRQAAELGLDSKGTKADILARVERYLKEQEEDLLEEEEGEGEEGEGERAGQEVEEEKSKKEATAASNEQNMTTAAQPEHTATPPIATTASLHLAPQVSVATETSSGKKTVTLSTTGLTPDEKMQWRADKFGENSSEQAKKMAREQRFGTSLDNGLSKSLPLSICRSGDVEKMQKRAARFGSSVAPAMLVAGDTEKKMKRRERFGLTTADLPSEDRKRARLQRFGAN